MTDAVVLLSYHLEKMQALRQAWLCDGCEELLPIAEATHRINAYEGMAAALRATGWRCDD